MLTVNDITSHNVHLDGRNLTPTVGFWVIDGLDGLFEGTVKNTTVVRVHFEIDYLVSGEVFVL